MESSLLLEGSVLADVTVLLSICLYMCNTVCACMRKSVLCVYVNRGI